MKQAWMQKCGSMVVKLGSSSLTYPQGRLDIGQIERIVRQVADLKNRGIQVVMVTSGAIAAGMGYLDYAQKPSSIPERQACAAIGQGKLMHLYEKLFAEYGYGVGQILLTKEDLRDKKRFMNARNAIRVLMAKNIIPIINENDAVAVDEIKVGDNDTLSALVAAFVAAEVLVILSDIDGLYDANPKDNPHARLIPMVEEITQNILNSAGKEGSHIGTGGMQTKLTAAKIVTRSGIAMVIAPGRRPNVLQELVEGKEIGTLFMPRPHTLRLRKNWIAYNSKPMGKIIVDDGAKKALMDNKSLLPSGIISVEGSFEAGDVVDVFCAENIVGKGLTQFSSEEIQKIKGKKTVEIRSTEDMESAGVVVHKNDLVCDI